MIYPEHKANLKKLAKYLATLPDDYEKFHMKVYCSTIDEGGYVGDEDFGPNQADAILSNKCGTVACALGHGPSAGIMPTKDDHFWDQYSENHFGLVWGSDGWTHCFDVEWAQDPETNTPKAAAKRIHEYLNA